jgi:two-component system sensor histidine kinase CreC
LVTVSIRWRLVLAFLLAIGLGMFLLVHSLLDDLRPRYLEAMEETMVDAAAVLAADVSHSLRPDGAIDSADLAAAMRDAKARQLPARIYELDKTRIAMRVYVTDAAGMVVYDSDEPSEVGKDYSRWRDVRLTLAGAYGARATRLVPDDARSAVLYVGAPIRSGEKIVGCLTVCKPADAVTLFVEVARRKIIAGGLAAAAVVALLGAAISYWVTRPIERLTIYARELKEGGRPAPPALGPGELRRLGAAFEEMRDALEGRRYAEQYVQNLTHEMKSPLSAIRAAAELLAEDMPPEARARFLGNIRAESERLRAMVDRLLQLSALENRKELRDVAAVDLGRLAGAVIDAFAPQLAEKRLTVERRLAEGAVVRGEEFLLRQALANLVQNAIDFSPPGGAIEVAVASAEAGAEITVADRGAGIPDYAVGRVFERFYSLARPGTGLKGTGLGLTFVREAALLHQGAATLVNREGGGALATVRLPPGGRRSSHVLVGQATVRSPDAHTPPT